MQREKAIRLAYFNALNGNLTYGGNPVHVYDSKVENNDLIYVILGNQNTTPVAPNFDEYYYHSLMNVIVVSRFQNSVSKDVVDDVGDQIESIILTSTPHGNGLVQQVGWDIENVKLENARYQSDEYLHMDTTSSLEKVVVFSQFVSRSTN